jgi:outer membrane protein
MRWKRSYNLVLICLLAWPYSSKAQQKYQLQELVQIALRENYQLQIVRNREQMAENRNNPGEAGMLPSVGIAADHNTDILTSQSRLYTGAERTGENAVSTRSGAAAELQWTIFDGFSMFARRDRLEHLAAISAADTRFYVEQTIGDLTHSYNLLVRELLLLDIYQNLSEVSSFRLNLEEQKKKLGSGNALQYNQALLDYNADSILVLQQKLRITEQQLRISKILNQPTNMLPYPAQNTLQVMGLQPLDQLLVKALKNNPEIRKNQLNEMIAEAENRIARAARYPRVDLFSNYAFNHQTSETGIIETATSRGAQLGIRVRFNLYDGGRQNTQIQNAAIALESTTIANADLKATIENDLAFLIAGYQNLVAQKQLLAKNRDATHRTLEIAREQLRNGTISGFEFRMAQNAVLHMQQQLIDVDLALITIETDINRICGTLTEVVLSQTP